MPVGRWLDFGRGNSDETAGYHIQSVALSITARETIVSQFKPLLESEDTIPYQMFEKQLFDAKVEFDLEPGLGRDRCAVWRLACGGLHTRHTWAITTPIDTTDNLKSLITWVE